MKKFLCLCGGLLLIATHAGAQQTIGEPEPPLPKLCEEPGIPSATPSTFQVEIRYADQCAYEQWTRLSYATAPTGPWTQFKQETGTTNTGWRRATAGGLTPDTTYYFKVEIRDELQVRTSPLRSATTYCHANLQIAPEPLSVGKTHLEVAYSEACTTENSTNVLYNTSGGTLGWRLVRSDPPAAVGSRTVRVDDLEPEQAFVFRVELEQPDGRKVALNQGPFTTESLTFEDCIPPQTPPDPLQKPPHIVTHPQPVTVGFGDAATLTVDAQNPLGTTVGLYYQWKRNGRPLTATPPFSGIHIKTLTIAAVSQAEHLGEYSVTVSNVYGQTHSSGARVAVAQPCTMEMVIVPHADQPPSVQWESGVDRDQTTCSSRSFTLKILARSSMKDVETGGIPKECVLQGRVMATGDAGSFTADLMRDGYEGVDGTPCSGVSELEFFPAVYVPDSESYIWRGQSKIALYSQK